MRKIITLVWSCFLLCACEQNGKDEKAIKTIHNRIDSLFDNFNTLDSPGYAIGVAVGDTTYYQKGYGAANLEYNLPITPISAFSLASVSKQFTAACIALLILEEKIALDTPVMQFIPELQKYSDTIRVKHLIYNTSGIRDYYYLPRADGKSWITFNYFDVNTCIATSLGEDVLQFKPGTQWDYCNVNFMLLTKIVEKVSGKAFSKFAREELFEPLGMYNTLINDDVTQIIKNRVTPYNVRTKAYVDSYGEMGIQIQEEGSYLQHHRNAPHYGGSGVVSTIEDLLKWSKNMVTMEFGGQPFFDLMHTTGNFEHDRKNQAFGLYFGDFNGREIAAWDGGDWGISSQMMRFPEEKVAIIVLSNLGSGESYRKANQIADILIEEGLME
ncbi:MAG: serine hydrolase domain-containing protein [Bacteroidota bacterium]